MDQTTYSDARANLAALMDKVTSHREPVIIRRRGHDAVALIAADELASLMETAHLLSSPPNARRLLRSLEDAKKARNLVRASLSELRGMIEDK